MRLNSKIYYLILLLLLGCESEFNFDLPLDKKIVLNTEMSPNNTIKVYLSTNRPAINQNEFNNINDAEVYVWVDNTTPIQLVYTPNTSTTNQLGSYTADIYPIAGHTYRIVAKHPNYDSITVTETIPDAIKLNAYSILSHPLYSSPQIPAKVKISFDDPLGKNYYLLDIWYILKYDTLDIATNTYLPVKKYYYGRNEKISGIEFTETFWGNKMFEDSQFEGQSPSFEVDITNPIIPKSDQHCFMYIDLRRVSEAYFLYQKTFDESRENYYDAFVDPIFVYNNINGGYGIAMSWVSDLKKLTVLP